MKLFGVLFSSFALVAAVSVKRQISDCNAEAYSDIILIGLNIHRANHSVGALVWNDTVAGFAQTTTTTGPPGVHDNTDRGFGQNLYYDGGAQYDTLGDAIDSWYNGELENYNTYGSAALIDVAPGVYLRPTAQPGEDHLHFTQVVWSDTTSVGCYTAPRTDFA